MSDRYDVSGNIEAQYVDAAQQVLKNKKGITDLHELYIEEENGLAYAYDQLINEVRFDTFMTTELIRYTHSMIFGDLYEWAGRWRTVRISKPGASWPPPDFLDGAMRDFERDILQKHPATSLTTDDIFCAALAQIQGEFLSIHPFREGNARTIKLVTDLLAAQSQRPILRYDMTAKGISLSIAAAKAALVKADYLPLRTIIKEALARARKPVVS